MPKNTVVVWWMVTYWCVTVNTDEDVASAIARGGGGVAMLFVELGTNVGGMYV